MQTTGAALVAAKWCSLIRVPLPAQGSPSAYGLLYLAAVRDHLHEHQACCRAAAPRGAPVAGLCVGDAGSAGAPHCRTAFRRSATLT
jgi:hypothetical protein